MQYIELTKGKVAVVDDDDYASLSVCKWSFCNRYAARRINSKLIYMHRLIMGAPTGIGVDHINGDALDNRRINLRLATQRQNAYNQSRHKRDGYKGVYFRKDTGKWQVKIMVDYKGVNLGCYTNEEIAAVAYDVAARIYFGEFARTNFDWGNPQRATNMTTPDTYAAKHRQGPIGVVALRFDASTTRFSDLTYRQPSGY